MLEHLSWAITLPRAYDSSKLSLVALTHRDFRVEPLWVTAIVIRSGIRRLRSPKPHRQTRT